MSRKKVVAIERTERLATEGCRPSYGFDYTMECGHVVRAQDFRRWRNGVLREPKTLHCDECKENEQRLLDASLGKVTYNQRGNRVGEAND